MGINKSLNNGHIGQHETFIPRYGWLKKGYECCIKEPHIFNTTNAIEKLGVGKNMVRSIRYWCMVCNLLTETEDKGKLKPTKLGIFLLDNQKGVDPFLEDIATIWLLHWQMFAVSQRTISWILAFNFCRLSEFTHKQLTEIIIKAASGYEKLSKISDKSFEKDASCIIRMYTPDSGKSEFSTPFQQLGLIQSRENGKFGFVLDGKINLPVLIFMATCFSYSNTLNKNAHSISLRDITFGINSPGIAFKLSESECGKLLDKGAQLLNGVDFVETAGIRQLQFHDDACLMYQNALDLYYRGSQ